MHQFAALTFAKNLGQPVGRGQELRQFARGVAAKALTDGSSAAAMASSVSATWASGRAIERDNRPDHGAGQGSGGNCDARSGPMPAKPSPNSGARPAASRGTASNATAGSNVAASNRSAIVHCRINHLARRALRHQPEETMQPAAQA